MKTLARDIAVLIVFLAVCLGAGVMGSSMNGAALAEWYPTLVKPWFTPPDWLFAPVWTLLYVLMGIAAFVVWRQDAERKTALAVFFLQLMLNALWTPVFFGLRSVAGGMVVMVLLLLAVAVTTVLFFRRSRLAAILLFPYLAWTAFAAFLNLSLLVLNT